MPTDFVVHLTGNLGQEVFLPGWPKTLKGQQVHGKGGKPDRWVAHTQTPCDPSVFDARNSTTAKVAAGGPGNPGGAGAGGVATVTADLRIEALADDGHGHLQNQNIFEALSAIEGLETEMLIPDLYLSDESGQLIDGGVLYSLVDLNTYLLSPPTFDLGDVFQIVDGKVAGLTGMTFSTTPFVFDATGGTGYSGTPADGFGYTLTDHGFTATPEPSSWGLMIVGFLGLGAMLRRRRLGHDVLAG